MRQIASSLYMCPCVDGHWPSFFAYVKLAAKDLSGEYASAIGLRVTWHGFHFNRTTE